MSYLNRDIHLDQIRYWTELATTNFTGKKWSFAPTKKNSMICCSDKRVFMRACWERRTLIICLETRNIRHIFRRNNWHIFRKNIVCCSDKRVFTRASWERRTSIIIRRSSESWPPATLRQFSYPSHYPCLYNLLRKYPFFHYLCVYLPKKETFNLDDTWKRETCVFREGRTGCWNIKETRSKLVSLPIQRDSDTLKIQLSAIIDGLILRKVPLTRC